MTNDAQIAMAQTASELEGLIASGMWVVIGLLVASTALMIAKPVLHTALETFESIFARIS
jgi:hypothetical protein